MAKKNNVFFQHKAPIIMAMISTIILIGTAVCFSINLANTDAGISAFIITIGLICAVLIILWWSVNRSCARIWYNEKEKTIERKGLLFGCEKSLMVEDIQKVIIMQRNGRRILIIYDEGVSESNIVILNQTIVLKYCQHNLDLIKEFWNKPMENCC